MRLPANSLIASEKLTRYLLVPHARADKSRFLARAGYSLQNAGQLAADIRQQILPLDARLADRNQFGDYYEIRGQLVGPNGVVLRVLTIWLTESLSGRTKFITLLPDKTQRE
jgi:hypothetical protein